MNSSRVDMQSKIRAEHLERAAYVYARQSSLRQVHEHVDGKRRQYELVDWVGQIGWPKERIVVVDKIWQERRGGGQPESERLSFILLSFKRLSLPGTDEG